MPLCRPLEKGWKLILSQLAPHHFIQGELSVGIEGDAKFADLDTLESYRYCIGLTF